jgi:hypothetical protein
MGGMSTMVAPRDMTVDRIFAAAPPGSGTAAGASTAYPVNPPIELKAGQVALVQINADGTASLILLGATPIFDSLSCELGFTTASI